MVHYLPTSLTKGNKEHASDEELVGAEDTKKNDEVLGYANLEVITEQPVLQDVRKRDVENLKLTLEKVTVGKLAQRRM